MSIRTTRLGPLRLGRIGLGAMGMSAFYTGAGSDDEESIRTLHRALDIGVNHVDTAESYGPFVNEELIGRALRGRRGDAVVATKFGLYSHVEGGPALDSRPANIRAALEGSLRRLGTDYVDLYYQHRVDPRVPIEDVVGTMAGLVAEGKVLALGLSEASPHTLRRACAVHPVVALQTEYSLWTRDPEKAVLPAARELGVAVVAYSPLGHGFLTGSLETLDALDETDWRRTNPRFQPEALERNSRIVSEVRGVAAEVGAAPGQVALAWLLARGDHVVPIPGTRRTEHLQQNAAADALELTAAQIARLDGVPTAVGERLRPEQLATIDE